MKFTTKRNAIVFAIVSVLALVIGILLVPVVSVFAGIVITLAVLALVYAVVNLIVIIRAEREDEEDYYEDDDERETTVSEKNNVWRDVVRILTLVGVVIIIILLVKGCGKQKVKEQIVEKQTVINQEVVNSTMENVDIENADIENATIVDADIEDATIEHATIVDADIANADIGNATIDNADIANADIENATIENANIENAEIKNATSISTTTTKSEVVKPAETPKTEASAHVCAVANTITVNATCTENGSVKTVCSCGKTLSEKTVKATGHNWDEGKVTKAATEKSDGTKTLTCKVCGETKTEVIAKLSHVCAVANTVTVDATCTEDGSVKTVCSCGKTLSEKTVKATGHSWDSGKVTKAATEKATGIKTYTCKNCGETKTETIAKLEHECEACDVIEKEATCTKAGYIREVCSCGEILSEKTVKATGHSWNKGKVTKAATEKSTGIKTYTCKNCGETKTETIAKLEHECEVCDVVEKEATCTKAGYIRKVCSCGEILSEKTVKATGHDYEVVSEKEATSTVDGYVKYRCANCGDTYKDVIPATGEVEEPVEDEFVITVSKTEVVGNSFSAIEVYTSGSASALKYYQGGNVFNVTVKDAHHLTLTVGDEDTFGSIIIYDDAHQDKAIEVIRRSPVDPLA